MLWGCQERRRTASDDRERRRQNPGQALTEWLATFDPDLRSICFGVMSQNGTRDRIDAQTTSTSRPPRAFGCA